MFNRTSKLGFTLAEVLITLTVIGIVAAESIPVLYVNIETSKAIAGYKTASYIVSQADLMNRVGGVSTRDLYTHESDAGAALFQHMNCMTTGYTGDSALDEGFKAEDTIMLNGNSAAGWAGPMWSQYCKLPNGMNMWCAAVSNAGTNNFMVNLFVDINGHKGNMQLGKDVFEIDVNQNGVAFARKEDWHCDPTDMGETFSGAGCGYFIIKNGKLPF